ncbi:MAG: acetolactate synthase large subunit [Candidatus Nomurabacteria bacterium]|nr:acetolactate synthase large subunit [Candidatus Nomurabacteria bacterium]
MQKVQKNASDVFVECLENEGVQYVFGVPGEENLTFLEAIRNSKITFITTRHEQGAVFMAATIGRLTGKVGVALSTLGPGATNLFTGVAYAQLAGIPLLVITGQKPIKKSKQGKFQIIDVVEMMKPVTKFSETIISGDKVPSLVREAIRLAEAERPGAVHLELPEDIALESCKVDPIIPYNARRPVADAKSITMALEVIENSKNPLIVVASGGNRKLVRKQLQIFLEKTGIPFVSTQMGKGVENENSKLYIGTTSLSDGDYVHQVLRKADTIIMIGHDISEKPPIVLTPENCKVIHINFYPAFLDDVYIPTLEVVGDISHTLWAFSENIKNNPAWDFNYFFKVRDMLKKDIATFSNSKDFPMRPERIVSDISKVLPDDGMLALDNGMYKIWIARNFVSKEQNSILLDNALATMGAGLPSGIASKILYPNKKVLVVAGDGGFMMNIAELETAVRLGVNLTVLILDDSGFGMIRWKQKDMNLSEFGLSFKNPDFVVLAKSFGAIGHLVKKADDLVTLLKKTLNAKGVHIIACPINYKDANKILGLIKSKTTK